MEPITACEGYVEEMGRSSTANIRTYYSPQDNAPNRVMQTQLIISPSLDTVGSGCNPYKLQLFTYLHNHCGPKS